MNRITKAVIISLLLIIFTPMAKLSAQVSTWNEKEVVNYTNRVTNAFQIHASAIVFNGPGTIIPNGYISVIEGENQSFEISPVTHSILDSVLVDGVNVGPVSSYIFHNVTEDHSIYAYFTLISTPDLAPWDGITKNEPFSFENHYYICSPTELAWIAQQTNNGISFSGKSIYLLNDIDLGGTQTIPSTWIPIGTVLHPFMGLFQGNKNHINNLFCNNLGNDNVGLFGFVEAANIRYVWLHKAFVVGKNNVGGLVGYLKNSYLINNRVTGIIRGNSGIGGVIGSAYYDEQYQYFGNNAIASCFSIIEIESSETAGGLIGKVTKKLDSSRGNISSSFIAGVVHSLGVSGGLIGSVDLGSDYENAGALEIYGCYSNATVLGTKCGGLIGQRECHSIGYGNIYMGSLSISESVVTGRVENGYGFIGKDTNVSGEIATCSTCFFDEQSTGCGDNDITGVSPKKTSEMTTNIGFGLIGEWWVYTNGLYPQSRLAESTNEEDRAMSNLFASPIFLQNNEKSSEVHSNFQVSTINGVNWSSSNPNVIGINGSNATVNTMMIDKTVTLTAALGNVSKKINITVADSDTILIYQSNDLRFIAEQCNAGVTYEGMYIKLMNDITLPLHVPNNMISIGSYPDHPFKGTFDGNGKLISNLYIDQPNTPYQGFFGYTLNANLFNVGLVSITASGRNYTGGMVAYAKNTHMRDCYVNGGTLFALSYCGGLVGYQEQGTNSIISGCYNTCEVTGNNYVGGLIGFSNYSTVRNSYVAGRVSAQGEPVGAIIGGANEVLMYYCYFSTELTGQTNAIGWNNIGKDGEGMTNAQMRDPQFVNTLNQNLATPVWMADYANHINNGFPIIKWQRPGTGVEEHDATPNYISLYPNPANDKVTIEGEDIRHITISNMLGQIVYDGNASGNAFEYDFSKHKTGIYLIRIETVNGVAVKKVSVTR